MQQSTIGFYFHIPFCPHICPYCDFVKTSKFTRTNINSYFSLLLRSLENFLEIYKENPFVLNSNHCTVYFGGGTPSLFPASFYLPLIERLSKQFILEEVSIETNPFTNKQNFIKDYKDIGINRVTLGAQSLCDNTLSFLGRKHTKKDILNNINWIRENGIENIQVDLIYGINTKRSISIENEIKEISCQGATGISTYGLTIESRTSFGLEKKQFSDETKAIDEYNLILKSCNNLNLIQFETSNFGFSPPKHNQIYWYGYPYFGIGTGAHGLLPATLENPYGIRYKVGSTPKQLAPGNDLLLFEKTEDQNTNFINIYEDPRTKIQMIEELIFTLLRTNNGIPLTWLCSVLEHENIKEKLFSNPQIARAIHENKLIINDTHLTVDAQEKIRGDSWALTLISCLL